MLTSERGGKVPRAGPKRQEGHRGKVPIIGHSVSPRVRWVLTQVGISGERDEGKATRKWN